MGGWKNEHEAFEKAAAVSLAALAAAGMIAGCGGEKKASAPSSQPAAQTVKINFPTAGASGALYAVGRQSPICGTITFPVCRQRARLPQAELPT